MNGKSFPWVSHVLEQHVTQLMIGGIIISIRTIKKINKHVTMKITKLLRIYQYVEVEEVVNLKRKSRQEYTVVKVYLHFLVYSDYRISNFTLKQIFDELNICVCICTWHIYQKKCILCTRISFVDFLCNFCTCVP